MKQKLLVAALALTLVLCIAMGVTLAWLTARTQSITNVFTFGNVTLTLEETTGTDYKGTPGGTMPKDPTITVKAGSEDCYVFVKIEESGDDVVNWAIAEGWTELSIDAGTSIYYREYSSTEFVDEETVKKDQDEAYAVLLDNEVTFESGADSSSQASMTITAYACQKHADIAGAAAAWDLVKDLEAPETDPPADPEP